jgi:hypothetical protein
MRPILVATEETVPFIAILSTDCMNFRSKNIGMLTAILVRWSAVQRTTEMIADQRTGKNSGPALEDYRNGASAIPLFCIFWRILKKYLKVKKSAEILGLVAQSVMSASDTREQRMAGTPKRPPAHP